MKYEVELPDDIDRRLCKKASASGDDVARLICIAVGRFVGDDVPTANGAWSEESETRRRALIDMDIAGTISADELAELARLDRLANEHFDQISPPLIEKARQLHDRLLQRRGNNGH
jgi:hypothetical protein